MSIEERSSLKQQKVESHLDEAQSTVIKKKVKVEEEKKIGQSSVQQYENLKTLLKSLKSKVSGKDLLDHLQQVFKKLVLHFPDRALQKLEEVSYLLKTGQLDEFLVTEQINSYKDLSKDLDQYIKTMQQYYSKGPVGEDEEEVQELNPIGYIPDILEESRVWEWAGVGLGEEEAFLLIKSLKKLVQESAASQVRFFGKILGSQKDYFIVEGQAEGEDDEERPPEFEPKGTGINKYSYWVTDNIIKGKWVKLPDLMPGDIRAARQIKVVFSGNLDRQIYTNPYFFGREKEYLRAQIGRISHSTNVCPKILYRVVEDNDKEIEEFQPEEGELVMPSTKEMMQLSNWVHLQPGILKNGRVMHMDPEQPDDAPDDFDIEEVKKQIENLDPYDKRLKPLNLDTQIQIAHAYQSSWQLKLMGDPTEYLNEKNQNVIYGAVLLKSLVWPGSFTFYQQGKQYNIYIGYGQKYEQTNYFPLYPPLIMNDPQEYQLQPEPTPLEEEIIEQEQEQQEEEKEEEY